MNLRKFDLNLLLSLDALLREKNVTRAAERVFISQPAMSAALARLREYFDDPLLVRSGRELQLTARALALECPIQEALLQVQAALGSRPTFDPVLARRDFSIMIPDFLSPLVIPGVLRTTMRVAAGVRVQLQSWSRNGPAHLESGEIDFFITLDAPRMLGLAHFPANLARTELCSIRWVCIAARDHATLGDALTKEQYVQLPHVYIRVPGDTYSLDEAVRRQLRMKLDVRVTTQSVLEVPFMLRGTQLIAVLPEYLAVQLANCTDVKAVELPSGLTPRRRVDIFWHRRSEYDVGHEWLRQQMCRSSQEALMSIARSAASSQPDPQSSARDETIRGR